MINKIAGFHITLFLILLTGCAPTKVIWTSSPEIQIFQNKYYSAQLEALKGDQKGEHNFFVLFRLTLNNQTDKMLKIDWNKTRYIYNDYVRGGFVFKGIKAKDIKNLTIPHDLIHPGDTFSKEIAPVKLITWARLRDRSVGKDDSGFSPGIIPEGNNGIYLVVRYNGQEVRKKITLTIESKDIK